MNPTVRQAVRQMRSPDEDLRRAAGEQLADYEQRTIVQRQVLSDPITRAVFDMNQQIASTPPGRWLGARKPEVALTSGCDDGTAAVPFSGRFVSADARVSYYTSQLVPAFEGIPDARRAAIIADIAGRRR